MTNTASKLLALTLAGVVATAAFALFTLQVSAHGGDRGGDGDRTEINTSNGAHVSNGVIVVANTGGNRADGGNSGNGADGGNGSGAGLFSAISSNDGGDGGNGGRGGDGGTITTGAAEAWGTVQNNVNNNRVVVEGCGCDEPEPRNIRYQRNNDGDKIEVNTRNRASVENGLAVMANTGLNSVDGGNGARGGAGGDGYGAWFSWFSLYSDNDGGDGGNGGAGANGGTVRTGTAYSNGLVANVVNSNVVRVNNGGR